MLESGDWSEFPLLFDRIYRICQFYAGCKPKSFVEFLLENGLADEVEEWWPGYLVPDIGPARESSSSPCGKKRQLDTLLDGNDAKRQRRHPESIAKPITDDRDARIESLKKEIKILRERQRQLFYLAA